MALPNPQYASSIAKNRAKLERSGTSVRLTLALTRFTDDGSANFRTFVTFQRKTHCTFHRRTVPFRTRNFYFKVAKQNVSSCTWTCRAKLQASLVTRTWQIVRSDLICLLIVAFASRICFAVFCRKLRISTLTYCRHLDIGTLPLGMALLRTARFRLDRLHIRLGRFRSCLHKWITAPSAACNLWRRRTDLWPCCPSLSNPSGIDLCVAWRFWVTTIEWLLNTCPEI